MCRSGRVRNGSPGKYDFPIDFRQNAAGKSEGLRGQIVEEPDVERHRIFSTDAGGKAGGVGNVHIVSPAVYRQKHRIDRPVGQAGKDPFAVQRVSRDIVSFAFRFEDDADRVRSRYKSAL